MHLLIVDHALVDLNGHHYEYDCALVRAAEARGVRATVLANSAYRGRTDEMPIEPWFDLSYYDFGGGGARQLVYRLLSILPMGLVDRVRGLIRRVWQLRHRLSAANDNGFGRRLAEAVARFGLGAEDHILIHTVGLDELESLAAAMKQGGTVWPRLSVQLVRQPEEFSAGRQRGQRAGDVLGRLIASAGQRLALFADTTDLARTYADLTGRPFGMLPIAFRHGPLLAALGDRPAGKPITIGYLGNARAEKGYQHLPELVEALSRRPEWAGRLRFLFQSPFNIPSGEPGMATARDRLGRFPADLVTLEHRVLDTDGYYRLMAEMDVLVLPYDPARYAVRSSGILTQARVAGIPLVLPEGSWMARQVAPPAGERFRGPRDLANAVGRLIDRFDAAEAAARDEAAVWRVEHSPARYLDLLGIPAR